MPRDVIHPSMWPFTYDALWLCSMSEVLVSPFWYRVAPLAVFFVRQTQRSSESLHVGIHRDLLQHEDQLETAHAFCGRLE